MLTRTGLILKETPELKKHLTVHTLDAGYGSTSFRVYRTDGKGTFCVPRHSTSHPVTRDTRPDPVHAHIRFHGTLRDYQHEACEAYMKSGSGGVVSIYCGGGKTTVALALAARLKFRTLIIVHKEFLANQWRERIAQFCPGSSVGRIQGDEFDVEHDFVIAMIQTLCVRKFPIGTFDSFGLVVVDEAHHIGAPAFSQSMFTMCPKWTLGLTATPERKDGLTRILYWFLGPEVYRLERREQSQVKVVKVTTHVSWIHGTHVQLITQLVQDELRNKQIIDLIKNLSPCRKVLVLSERRGHCESMHSATSDSALYIGGMSEDELKESSTKRILFGTYSLAHEGLDIPELDTLVLATPRADVVQAVGRILRGKSDPMIYDIVDPCGHLFGMWKKRRALYKQCGFEIEQEQNKCLFVVKS